jgi:hypothetical protein
VHLYEFVEFVCIIHVLSYLLWYNIFLVSVGPDASTTSLTPSTTSYTRNEESSLDTIRCSGDCYPTCNYKWTKTGNIRFTPVNNGNLSLGSLQRDEAGTYTCTVSNPTSKQEQTKTVSIYVICK